MNKWEKELARLELKGEKRVLDEMRGSYKIALDRVNERIAELAKRDDLSGIRQKRYQEALAKQIGAIIDDLGASANRTLEGYLTECYEQGFMGSLYSLQKQDIPLAFPLDQAKVARAVTMTADDVKLSKRIYANTSRLKREVIAEITRGFADGSSSTQVAQHMVTGTSIEAGIRRNVKGRTDQALRRAMTIARTEKGRVMADARLEAMRKAKEAGADVVKQWDSTMDSRTRKDHKKLDGQIRELDEPFEVSGHKGMAPHKFGRPEEDINCRCVCLQRARAALEMPESAKSTKWDGKDQCFVDLSDAKNYQDFKRRYEKLASVEIDEWTPCLRRLSDGAIVQTRIERAHPRPGEYEEWEFDWSIPERNGFEVLALVADGDDRVQGLVAVKPIPSNRSVLVDLVEAAPFNSRHNKAAVGKEYAGVGAHLFAEAVRVSYGLGYNGFVEFIAKTNLIEHYKKELGATQIGSSQVMCIDERAAKLLYERYYGDKT